MCGWRRRLHRGVDSSGRSALRSPHLPGPPLPPPPSPPHWERRENDNKKLLFQALPPSLHRKSGGSKTQFLFVFLPPLPVRGGGRGRERRAGVVRAGRGRGGGRGRREGRSPSGRQPHPHLRRP